MNRRAWQIFTVAVASSMAAASVAYGFYGFAIGYLYIAVINAVFAKEDDK